MQKRKKSDNKILNQALKDIYGILSLPNLGAIILYHKFFISDSLQMFCNEHDSIFSDGDDR